MLDVKDVLKRAVLRMGLGAVEAYQTVAGWVMRKDRPHVRRLRVNA